MFFTFPLITQVKVSIITFFSFILLLLFGCNFSLLAQIHLSGHVIDVDTKQPLAYVNIGIKVKNIGTTSLADGSFSITIPQEYATDTLTFSLVGYHPFDLPISNGLHANESLFILLKEKITQLGEVNITAEKLVEKKYGIKRRNLLLHFTDGMFEKKDIFEIAQVIKLGNRAAQITSVNLHINAQELTVLVSGSIFTGFLMAARQKGSLKKVFCKDTLSNKAGSSLICKAII